MKPLRLHEVWTLLPGLEELQPLLSALLARSAPDPERTWSGAGEMETAGDRYLTDLPGPSEVEAMSEAARERQESVLREVIEALSALGQGDGAAAAECFLRLAGREEQEGAWGRVDAWARSAFEAARDSSDPLLAARALRRRGRAARARGRLDEALVFYRDGSERAGMLGDPRGAAEGAVGAGNALEEQGRWDEAEAWYRTALGLLEPLGAPVPERWHALLNLHIVLRSRGDLAESRPLLERAEAEARSLGDESAAPFLLNARGQLEMLVGRPDDAESHFRRALALAPTPGAGVTVRLNLAETLLARGRLLEAAEETRTAEAEAIRNGLAQRLPEVYRLLGRVAAARKSPEAFVLFERALELLRSGSRSALEEAVTLQAYARAEAERGEDEVARELLERAMQLYATVGISEPRHPWTDYFGPPTSREPDPSTERNTP
jgi:tetratricopeptide (TPR) repeat protein